MNQHPGPPKAIPTLCQARTARVRIAVGVVVAGVGRLQRDQPALFCLLRVAGAYHSMSFTRVNYRTLVSELATHHSVVDGPGIPVVVATRTVVRCFLLSRSMEPCLQLPVSWDNGHSSKSIVAAVVPTPNVFTSR
jgi:hypothetical protein